MTELDELIQYWKDNLAQYQHNFTALVIDILLSTIKHLEELKSIKGGPK